MGTRQGTRGSAKGRTRIGWRIPVIVLSIMALMAGTIALAIQPASAAYAGQRIDLKVLVVSDGNPTEAAIVAELDSESIPYTRVDLGSSSRPIINAAFLSGTSGATPEAYYQAVVLPNDAPAQLSADEKTALAAYEATFDVRQVDSYTYPGASTGLTTTGGYTGSLDGMTAGVTAAGSAGPFSYLNGPVKFEDNDPSVGETYGYIGVPLADTADQTFTTLVDAPIPGTAQRGSILGVVKHGTRQELVSTISINQDQSEFQLLAHGIITWMTNGVHLGYDRNYFTVQVDDLFLPDSRWSTTAHCTPGDDCPPGSTATTPDIRMTAADVTTAVQWSQAQSFRLDLAFNGGGSDEWAAANGGTDALKTAVLANKGSFNFINHTFTHEFLGCTQDFSVTPWQCKTVNGVTQYMSQAEIQSQISDNVNWANANGLPINASELVTGEHSGLKTLPQQPDDNPNLAPALAATGIAVTASDHSREPDSRQIGNTTTVPRYPMSVFYNTATKAEAVSEYNWIYGSAADGGSGYCSAHPDTTTCIAPLDPATGYDNYIVPTETRIDMGHILGNDPRPHYAHVSNLAEEKILYEPLNSIIGNYRSIFAPDTPIVQPTYTEDAQILKEHAAFAAVLATPGGTREVAAGLSAYVLDGTVIVDAANGTQVPLTAPIGSRLGNTTGPDFGTRYEGEQSAWNTVGPTPFVVVLPLGWTTPPTTTTAPPTTTTAPPTTTTGPPTTTTTPPTTTSGPPATGSSVGTPDGKGYWLFAADGGVFTHGDAQFYGSEGALKLAKPIVAAAATPSGHGYWLFAADGGVFTHGDAKFYGSEGARKLAQPIVSAVATPTGKGYWLFAADGGVFTHGDAQFYGSEGALKLAKPIVAAAATPSGHGYWLFAADGGVFTHGDARFYGSEGALKLAKPIVAAAATPHGYRLFASDGGVFTHGDARFYGSEGALKLAKPVVAAAATADSQGYWMFAADGGVFTHGNVGFYGSEGALKLAQPIVAAASTPTAGSAGS